MLRVTDIALGAGAALAVVLGFVALRPDAVPTTDPEPVRTTATATASASPKQTATPKPTRVPTSKPESVDAPAWVVGASKDLVVRAPQRTCTAKGPTSITVIGGNGEAVDREVAGLRAVGGFHVTGPRSIVLVGVDGACERVGYGTEDRGRTWKALDKVPSIWSVVPGDTSELHAPSGQVKVPCAPSSVTGLDDSVARLSCTDGRLLGTITGGADWSILGNNPGLKTVGFVSSGSALAFVDAAECEGVQVAASSNGGTRFTPSYCAEGVGPWGLVTGAGTAVVTGLDMVFRSTDGGKTWTVTKVHA